MLLVPVVGELSVDAPVLEYAALNRTGCPVAIVAIEMA
jgi:hypothetical protein